MEIDKIIQWYTLRPDVSRFLCDLRQPFVCDSRIIPIPLRMTLTRRVAGIFKQTSSSGACYAVRSAKAVSYDPNVHRIRYEQRQIALNRRAMGFASATSQRADVHAANRSTYLKAHGY